MKILKYVGDLASLCKWCGVLAIGVNYQESQWVLLCSGIALVGLATDSLSRAIVNAKVRELNQVSSLERSYLNVIKAKAEKNEVIDSDLIQRATSLGKDADAAHKAIYGFSRPAACIGVKVKMRLEDATECFKLIKAANRAD